MTAEIRTARLGLVLVGLLLVAANLRASITSVGPVLADIRGEVGLSAAAASVLISLPLVAFAVVSPFAPVVARALGAERTLGGALVVLAVGIVLRSVPSSLALWGGTALLGVAIAVLNVVLPSVVKRDFPSRLGQVTGAYSAVQSLCAAAAAGLAVPIAGVSGHGWRLAIGLWAALAVIALGVLAPQLRRGAEHGAAASDRPTGPMGRAPWRTALGWQVTIFMGLQSVTYYTVITWLPSIEQSHGVSAAGAGLHQFLLNAFAIAGSLGVASLLHRGRDQRPVVLLVTCCSTLCIAGVLVLPGLDAVWVGFGGLGVGGSIVVALSLFGLRTGHHRQAAALSGMAQSIGYLAAAAAPVVLGAVHDATGSWRPALIILLCLAAVQLAAGLLAGRDRRIP